MKSKLRWVLLFAPALLFAGGFSLEEVVANRALWPTEVTLTSSVRGTVIKDGNPGGAMLVGQGRVMSVTEITADTVTGRLGSVLISVPLNKTDLAQRAGGFEPPAAKAAPKAAAAARAAPPPAASAEGSKMERMLAGKLVQYRAGKLVNVEPAALSGVKYYALYYSASWCGPCRQFTPGFVKAYQQLKAEHPEFEAVFVSADHSAGDMLSYIRDDKMPWPAVKYDQRSNEMTRYSGPGIPCLVLVDANGRVLADSFENGNYVGPQRVLETTRKLLKKG